MPDEQNEHPESDKAPQDDSPPPEPSEDIDEGGVASANLTGGGRVHRNRQTGQIITERQGMEVLS